MGDAFEYYEGYEASNIYTCIMEDIEYKRITRYSPIQVKCYATPSLDGTYYALDWTDKYERYVRFSEKK